MTNTLNLEELKRLAEEATPGPWYGFFDGVRIEPDVFGKYNASRYIAGVSSTLGKTELEKNNAMHIAAFNPAIALQLIATIEQQAERIKALEAENEKWKSYRKMTGGGSGRRDVASGGSGIRSTEMGGNSGHIISTPSPNDRIPKAGIIKDKST